MLEGDISNPVAVSVLHCEQRSFPLRLKIPTTLPNIALTVVTQLLSNKSSRALCVDTL